MKITLVCTVFMFTFMTTYSTHHIKSITQKPCQSTRIHTNGSFWQNWLVGQTQQVLLGDSNQEQIIKTIDWDMIEQLLHKLINDSHYLYLYHVYGAFFWLDYHTELEEIKQIFTLILIKTLIKYPERGHIFATDLAFFFKQFIINQSRNTKVDELATTRREIRHYFQNYGCNTTLDVPTNELLDEVYIRLITDPSLYEWQLT